MNSSLKGLIGEAYVCRWLINNHYTVTKWDTKAPGSTDIETSGPENLLIQVKTTLSSSALEKPTADEVRNIKSRAANIGRVARVALVKIDDQGSLVGDITWAKP